MTGVTIDAAEIRERLVELQRRLDMENRELSGSFHSDGNPLCCGNIGFLDDEILFIESIIETIDAAACKQGNPYLTPVARGAQ